MMGKFLFFRIVIQVALVPMAAAGGGQWPMFHHDSHLTGRSEYVGAQTNNVKWTYSTSGRIHSSPAKDSYLVSSDGDIYFDEMRMLAEDRIESRCTFYGRDMYRKAKAELHAERPNLKEWELQSSK